MTFHVMQQLTKDRGVQRDTVGRQVAVHVEHESGRRPRAWERRVRLFMDPRIRRSQVPRGVSHEVLRVNRLHE